MGGVNIADSISRLEQRRNQRAHRLPPMPAHFYKSKYGRCRWCNEEIRLPEDPALLRLPQDKRRAGQINTRRMWHDGRHGERDCRSEHAVLMCEPDVCLPRLVERDGPLCACGCGRPVLVWIAGVSYPTLGALEAEQKANAGWPWMPVHMASGPFTITQRVWGKVQIDHKIPLWKVKHLPDTKRLQYFELGNQQIMITDPCHIRKSAEEAVDRAKGKRLRAKRIKPKGPLIAKDGTRLT